MLGLRLPGQCWVLPHLALHQDPPSPQPISGGVTEKRRKASNPRSWKGRVGQGSELTAVAKRFCVLLPGWCAGSWPGPGLQLHVTVLPMWGVSEWACGGVRGIGKGGMMGSS